MAAKNPETVPAPLFPESSFKYNPLLHVRILFVRFIQGLFSASQPGAYKWSDDPENTEIYITDEGVVQPSVIEKSPAVTLTRGPVQFYSLGLDDLHGYDFSLDKKTKGLLVPGTMTINAISRNDLESEHLAFIIARHIWLLRDLLMKSGFFEIGRSIQVGSPSAAGSLVANEQGDEYRATPVSVPYQFPELSSVTPLNREVVQHIEQTLHVRGIAKQFGLGSPRNNPAMDHEIAQSVHACWPEPFAPDALDLQRGDLPLQPHPLNPAMQVRVRVVRPVRTGLRPSPRAPTTIPIVSPCVEQSDSSAETFTQKG